MKTQSPEPQNNRNKKLIIVLVCIVILLVAAIGILLWKNPNGGNGLAESQTSQSVNSGLVVPERPEMIDITAYESIALKADTPEQSVRFDNPLENNCWLVITLSLEDGTVLWKSEELQPGQVVRSITMDRTLEAGEYENAVISYQHWTYDEEKLPLNGAETLVTLKVQ